MFGKNKKKTDENPYNIQDEYQYSTNENKPDDYIKNRLIPQIKWYDKKSAMYQKSYKDRTKISIVLSALIPVLTLTLDFGWFGIVTKILIASISSAVSVISGILTLERYKELWVQYRTNCELLKSVLHRYYTETAEFSSGDKEANFKLLVSSCETLFTKEFDAWSEIYSNQDKTKPSSQKNKTEPSSQKDET